MEPDNHVLLGHIVIGITQICIAAMQIFFHSANKKTVRENHDTLQKIEIVLKMNGYAKLAEKNKEDKIEKEL